MVLRPAFPLAFSPTCDSFPSSCLIDLDPLTMSLLHWFRLTQWHALLLSHLGVAMP